MATDNNEFTLMVGQEGLKALEEAEKVYSKQFIQTTSQLIAKMYEPAQFNQLPTFLTPPQTGTTTGNYQWVNNGVPVIDERPGPEDTTRLDGYNTATLPDFYSAEDRILFHVIKGYVIRIGVRGLQAKPENLSEAYHGYQNIDVHKFILNMEIVFI